VSVLAQIEASIPALRRYAWALLRHRPDADDLVQDALLRALDHLDPMMGEDGVRAWLFTIARNLFVIRLRKARVRGVSVPLDGVNAERLSAGAGQEWNLSMRDFLRGFDQLPDDQRQVLLLVAVEGFAYGDAAAILGVPVGTVMSRLSRARERLRVSMDGEASPKLRRVK